MSTASTTARIAGLAAAAALILGGATPALAVDHEIPPPQRPCATSPQDRIDRFPARVRARARTVVLRVRPG